MLPFTQWRLAIFFSISSCGLRLDDEAIRVAVGLRLSLPLSTLYQCHCGALVEAYGIHSFVCPGRTARYYVLNGLSARDFEQQQTRTPSTAIQSPCFISCGYRNSGHLGPPGGGTDTDRKTDGQHYWRCHGDNWPVSATIHGTTRGECGLNTKHVHNQLTCCKPLFFSFDFNVL